MRKNKQIYYICLRLDPYVCGYIFNILLDGGSPQFVCNTPHTYI